MRRDLVSKDARPHQKTMVFDKPVGASWGGAPGAGLTALQAGQMRLQGFQQAARRLNQSHEAPQNQHKDGFRKR